MAYRYRIEPSFGLIIDKFDGKMGWHDVLEGIQKASKDPEFRPGMNVVADLTDAELDFGFEGARSLAASTSDVSTMKYGRIAVVAPGPAQFGLARMFGTVAENSDVFEEFRVFTEFSKARTWLGLPEDLELRI